MEGPLKGIRVLDLSHAHAGPYGSMLLADLGAEVIKIEPPEGEMTRDLPGPTRAGETYYFLAFNRNKKSVTLDLWTEQGRETFYALVKVSQVVWDNFRPGVMERLGFDYESLKKVNPGIVCCSITGYGSSGPYRDFPSYDVVAAGITGLLSVTGEPGRPPVRPGPAIADLAAGFFGALGVVSALVRWATTGKGQKVETSLIDACLSLLGYHFSYYFCGGGVPQPQGGGHLAIVPFGVYPAKEGYVTLGLCWPRIARVIHKEWMVDDPRFSTVEARLAHREELEALLKEGLAQMKAEDWVQILRLEDIPAGPVNAIDKAAEDPQILHNNMVVSAKHPSGETLKMVGNPVKMPGLSGGEYAPPPALGQHNDEILRGLLGYAEDRIARLRQQEKERAAERARHLKRLL